MIAAPLAWFGEALCFPLSVFNDTIGIIGMQEEFWGIFGMKKAPTPKGEGKING